MVWASEGAQSGKGIVFTRPSILFRPRQKQAGECLNLLLVEPPGTAPGSEPLIARAFIAIVRRHDQYRDDLGALEGVKAVVSASGAADGSCIRGICQVPQII